MYLEIILISLQRIIQSIQDLKIFCDDREFPLHNNFFFFETSSIFHRGTIFIKTTVTTRTTSKIRR